jgi:hypothetical protein
VIEREHFTLWVRMRHQRGRRPPVTERLPKMEVLESIPDLYLVPE